MSWTRLCYARPKSSSCPSDTNVLEEIAKLSGDVMPTKSRIKCAITCPGKQLIWISMASLRREHEKDILCSNYGFRTSWGLNGDKFFELIDVSKPMTMNHHTQTNAPAQSQQQASTLFFNSFYLAGVSHAQICTGGKYTPTRPHTHSTHTEQRERQHGVQCPL